MEKKTLWSVIEELETRNRSYNSIKQHLGNDTLSKLYGLGKRYINGTFMPMLTKEGVAIVSGHFVLWPHGLQLAPDMPSRDFYPSLARQVEKYYTAGTRTAIQNNETLQIFTQEPFSSLTFTAVDMPHHAQKEVQLPYFIVKGAGEGVTLITRDLKNFLVDLVKTYKKETVHMGFVPCVYRADGSYIGTELAWLWGDSFTLVFSTSRPNEKLLPYCVNPTNSKTTFEPIKEREKYLFLTNVTKTVDTSK